MVEEKKAMGLTVLGSDMAKKITVLDAIHMAVEAWGKVKQSTIHNCFKKCLQDQSAQVDVKFFLGLAYVFFRNVLAKPAYLATAGSLNPDSCFSDHLVAISRLLL